MGRDILFDAGDFKFSFRVGGVAVRDGKILLQRDKGEYAIIGGHVMAFETAQQALVREFREELHADIEAERLFAVSEVFFRWRKPCHQIDFYYKIHIKDNGSIPTNGVFHGYDEQGGERTDLDYLWVPLSELGGITVYPRELVPIILRDNGGVEHFVSNELEEAADGES